MGDRMCEIAFYYNAQSAAEPSRRNILLLFVASLPSKMPCFP